MDGKYLAVVGSREGIPAGRIPSFARSLAAKHPGVIVVSGGARGADTQIEQEWLNLGGRVVSLRPKKLGDECFVVERWQLGANPGVIVLDVPSFANYESAALYRNMLIVEQADRVCAFLAEPGRWPSKGTHITIGLAEAKGIPVHKYEEK